METGKKGKVSLFMTVFYPLRLEFFKRRVDDDDDEQTTVQIQPVVNSPVPSGTSAVLLSRR